MDVILIYRKIKMTADCKVVLQNLIKSYLLSTFYEVLPKVGTVLPGK